VQYLKLLGIVLDSCVRLSGWGCLPLAETELWNAQHDIAALRCPFLPIATCSTRHVLAST